MRRRDSLQLFLSFRECHVEHDLTAFDAFQQELQGERRLARARHSFDQVQAAWREAVTQDFVEALNIRGDERV